MSTTTLTETERFVGALEDYFEARGQSESVAKHGGTATLVGAIKREDEALGRLVDAFNEAVDERVQQALDRWGMA